MYIIIKKDKAEHIHSKLRKVKEAVCEIAEFLEDAREIEHEDGYGRDDARGRGSMGRRRARPEEDDYDYDDDYDRDMARGRGSRGRGRY